MSTNAKSVVILAAGKGTRMYSALPKVLHHLAGKPMVQHVIDTALSLGAQNVHLVYGHGGDLLQNTLSDQNLNWGLHCLLYTSPSPRDRQKNRMPSSA